MVNALQEHYSDLFEQELLVEIAESGILKKVSEGDVLMDIGSYVRSMPLLINGIIKIMRTDDKGDELLLYFLEKGDTCAMTLTCCLGQTQSEIKAVAETDAKLIMIPISKMESFTSQYKSWRNFVFQSYHDRLMEMLNTIDTIAFMKMDERLLHYLLNKSEVTNSRIIQNTHQQIAYELHTSRVVISRLLKKLENEKKIKLDRNSIKLLSI